ncbi:hypothetical protein LOTGIDRAFT_214570 [Lottia gigantea]|uniref:Uncharacterized protein n=1 Tax=Lottia gigantea TaxID=225164 RepID=V4ARW9_LOTGI|nr:hypothetical protein LOTGIDRAFT_214570 [Lottia gigantea]ESO96446.1 hypothetical protein LOTGIDRAFT_214570 [Lottia gigantea]
MDLLKLFTGQNGDFLQDLGTLNFINSGDKEMLQRVTGARVAAYVFDKLTNEQEIEALRTATILSISKYVKDHPKASKEEMVKEIGKQIYEFQKKIESL